MAEVLHGNSNGDQIKANADKSQVYGLQGNDTLVSDGKSDILLVGGSGDDRLIVKGGGIHTLNGGAGSDTFELTYSAEQPLAAVIEDLDPSSDNIVVNFIGNSVPQLNAATDEFGNVIWSSADGLLTLVLKSVRENDYFDGEAGNEIWDVLWLTNAEREAQNLSPLTLSQGLTDAAQVRAWEITDLGANGVLTNHTRPNGANFSTVLNGRYLNYGENLDAGADSPDRVMEDWINSPAHYANILNADFRKLGVGYNYLDIDETDKRYYWTQLFADSLTTVETVDTAQLLSANVTVNAVTKFLPLTEGDDAYGNVEYGATIAALGGNDFIVNEGLITSISGGAGNDVLESGGAFTTINAGIGDDSINLSSNAKENLIHYTMGDGNDQISGLNLTDTVSISGGEYNRLIEINDSDILVRVGDDSITLLGAAKSGANVYGTESKFVRGTENSDTIENDFNNATIETDAGDDSIRNGYRNSTVGSNVSISAGLGNDSVSNFGSNVIVELGAGHDYIFSESNKHVTIIGGEGNDTIWTFVSEHISISGGEGDDSIKGLEIRDGEIDGGDGNDYIDDCYDSTINGGNGDDTISGNRSIIDGGSGNDFIYDGWYSTINGGDGDDTISGDHTLNGHSIIDGGSGNDFIYDSEDSTINGGDGDDTISGMDVTITGGLGNDSIRVYSSPQENSLINYRAGDGNDTILGRNYILNISEAQYVRSTIVNDIVLAVGAESITLLDAANSDSINIVGEGRDGISVSGDIMLTDGADTYSNVYRCATIQALGGDDYIENSGYDVLIESGAGNDTILNFGSNATINVSEGGNDIIALGESAQNNLIEYYASDSEGDNTIIGFDETDTLVFYGVTGNYSTQTSGNNIIVNVGSNSILLVGAAILPTVNTKVNWSVAASEDGIITLSDDNDRISNSLSAVAISGLNGNDLIWNYEGNSVTINGGAGDDTVDNDKSYDVSIDGGDGNDTVSNYESNSVTINAGAGDDTVDNDKSYDVSIDGGDGNDTVSNYKSNSVTINGGAGDDTIRNSGESYDVSIDGGDGNDTVSNYKSNSVTINAGAGNDTVDNYESYDVSIDSGEGNDTVDNYESYDVSIDSGEGNDSISNDESNSVTINAGAGDDTIRNSGESYDVSIDSGDGNDSIRNGLSHIMMLDSGGKHLSFDSVKGGDSVSIDGGADNDTISNGGSNVTINGGDGNDLITNGVSKVAVSNGKKIILFADLDEDTTLIDSVDGGNFSFIFGGEGNDTITNNGSNVTITGNAGDDSISLASNAQNIVINYALGDGNDTIYDYNETTTINVLDSGYTSIGSGDDIVLLVGDGSITLKDARDKPAHVIIGESGSDNGGSGGSDGGSSGSGGNNGGGGTDGGTSGSDNGNSDASGNQSASGAGGNTSSGNGGGNGSVNLPEVLARLVRFGYSGGDVTISNYRSGDKILFRANHDSLSYAYDTEENKFTVEVPAGKLVIENAVDKVVDLSDRMANPLLLSYAATNPGTIDGRGIDSFEVFQGSDLGSDEIFAGNDGSNLWGGGGNYSDILHGGNGADAFFTGKNEGNDAIQNASPVDTINLYDVNLSDIVATSSDGNVVGIQFNTGNVITAQSTDTLSAQFNFADGSSRRYNHETKSWQGA